MDPATLNLILFAGTALVLTAIYFMLQELKRIPKRYKAEYAQTIFSGVLAGLVFNLLNSLRQPSPSRTYPTYSGTCCSWWS